MADQRHAEDAASRSRPPSPATAAEVAALQDVYARLSDLLTVITTEIDRQLAADDALRRAMEVATGRPVQDPY